MAEIRWKTRLLRISLSDGKGIFYPESVPQTKMVTFYPEKFNTLELNVNFYRFPVLKEAFRFFNNTATAAAIKNSGG